MLRIFKVYKCIYIYTKTYIHIFMYHTNTNIIICYTHIHTSMLVYVCVSVLYMTYIHHMPTVGTGSVVFNVIFQYCIIKLQPATNLITQISYFVFFFFLF